MKISVIIPVYNAEKYVKSAVESALMQEETEEVILIEDGSPDGSLQVCRELAEKNEAVLLYRHPDNGNHGAGETRNLGIRKATCEYIAFLDADDFYMPGRFKTAKQLLYEKKDIDGVYEAIGVHCEDDAGKKTWMAARGGNVLTTLSRKVRPEDLFLFLLGDKSGNLHLDGLVVKKVLFQKCGYFFKHLRLHQDTAMIFQMAESGRLYPGRLDEAVAMRRVHSSNRIFSSYNRDKTQYLMWQTLFHWAGQKKVSKNKLARLYTEYQYKACRLAAAKDTGAMIKYQYLRVFLLESIRHYHLIGRFVCFLLNKLFQKRYSPT